MKVLIIVSSFPKSTDLVISPWALGQTKELAKFADCTVVSPTPNLKFPKFIMSILPKKVRKWSNIKRHRDFDNFTVFYPKVPLITYTRRARFNSPENVVNKWLKIIEKTVNVKKYDIILAHHPMVEGLIAAKLKYKYNIPFITIEHSYDDPFNGNREYQKNYALVANNADAFICPSKHVLNSIVAKYSVNNPVVIYNGGAVPRKKDAFDLSGKIKFVSVGALNDYKNHETIIRAFDDEILRKRSILKIIGEGQLKNKYQTIINDLGLQNVVTLLGYMKHEKVFEILDKSDVFILISNENFSVAAIEAIGRGLPVVVSESTGIPEVMNDKIQGFVIKDKDRMNINVVRHVLRKFVEKREIIPKMSNEAFELSKNLTWKYNAERMRNVFLSLLKENDFDSDKH